MPRYAACLRCYAICHADIAAAIMLLLLLSDARFYYDGADKAILRCRAIITLDALLPCAALLMPP